MRTALVISSMMLLAIVTSGLRGDPPATAPSTQPIGFQTDDPELAAAVRAFVELRAIDPEAPIDAINALQIRPSDWTDDKVRRDLRSGKTSTVAVLEGKAENNAAMLILRVDPEKTPIALGVARLVKIDGSWRALVVPPDGYRKGELTADQLKALEAIRPWARKRYDELKKG